MARLASSGLLLAFFVVGKEVDSDFFLPLLGFCWSVGACPIASDWSKFRMSRLPWEVEQRMFMAKTPSNLGIWGYMR